MAHATFERLRITLAGDMNTASVNAIHDRPMKQTPGAASDLAVGDILHANKAPEAVDVFAKNRDYLLKVLAGSEIGPALTGALALPSRRRLRANRQAPEAAPFDRSSRWACNVLKPLARASGQCADEGQQRLENASWAQRRSLRDRQFRRSRMKAAHHPRSGDVSGTQSDVIRRMRRYKKRGRMLYEAAWAPVLAEPESRRPRDRDARDAQEAQRVVVQVPLCRRFRSKLPLQPSEKRARGLYSARRPGRRHQSGDERVRTRGNAVACNEHDPALLLNDVLDKEPAPR